MISVLIPVYNYPVGDLVLNLIQQGEATGKNFEIILLDDGSSNYRNQYERWQNHDSVQLVRSGKNAGRSKSRNRLAELASHPYLLFLDCDGLPKNRQFLMRYIEIAAPGKVLVGGREYPENHEPHKTLHHLYGKKREQNASGFQSNNFLIAKEDFERIGGFDETLNQYGHEDTLFGVELRRAGISVTNIENPVYHIGLETNRAFVEKSLKAVENARELFMAGKIAASDIRLLEFYQRWEKSPLKKSLLRAICRKRRRWMKICLSDRPRLFALDFLKLCKLEELSKRA